MGYNTNLRNVDIATAIESQLALEMERLEQINDPDSDQGLAEGISDLCKHLL
jgi:hypothetical protein